MKILQYFGIIKYLNEQEQLSDDSLANACYTLGYDNNIINEFTDQAPYYYTLANKTLNPLEKLNLLNISYEELLQEQRKYYNAFAIHKGYRPRIVYKYKPLNKNAKDMLKENKMWFSSITMLNDINEGINPTSQKISREYLKNYIAYLKNKYTNVKESLLPNGNYDEFEEFYKKTVTTQIDNTKVASFTTTNTNRKMWALYTNSSSGICLEFDVIEDLDFFDPLMKINYTDEYPKISYLETPGEFPVKEVLFTKSKEWEEEDEYRALKMNDKEDKFTFNKKSLKSITFGFNCKLKEINEIKEILSENSYNVKLYKIEKVNNSFEFEANPI